MLQLVNTWALGWLKDKNFLEHPFGVKVETLRYPEHAAGYLGEQVLLTRPFEWHHACQQNEVNNAERPHVRCIATILALLTQLWRHI